MGIRGRFPAKLVRRIAIFVAASLFAGFVMGSLYGLPQIMTDTTTADVVALVGAVLALTAAVAAGMTTWQSWWVNESAREARASARDADAALADALDSVFSTPDSAQRATWGELQSAFQRLDAKLVSVNVSGETAAQIRQERDDLRQRLEHLTSEQDRERDELLLAPTWRAVNARLNSYHFDAQRQGRTAFVFAMSAMILGFLFLAGSAWLALGAQSTAGATVAGVLGATSAVVSGYVSRTFLRTYQETSVQLRGYFAQPVEAARFLFAERAIAVSGLPDAQRKDLMYALVQAMATGAMGEARVPQAPNTDPGEAN